MSQTPSYARAGVVAPHPAAATAARDILIEGGNAIEAAVAAAAVTSVVLAEAGGAGGDGLWLIREAGTRGRTRVLDARGPVGDAVTLRRFRDRDLDAIPSAGGDAILTVPGAVAGWRAALDLSKALGGSVPIRRLLEPAVLTAREGWPASDPTLGPLPAGFEQDAGMAEAFLIEGRPPASGTLRRALRWGETLGYLAQSGLDDFYAGDVGREVARDIGAIGGAVSRDDLRGFEPRWREPLSLRCGLGLVEAPSNRAAMAFLVALGLVERLGSARPGSAAQLHAQIEATKRAAGILADEEESGGNPAALLTPQRLLSERERIDMTRASALGLAPAASEDSLWIGVVDAQGMAVSCVASIGTLYGAGRILQRTGVLMGNRGARFALDDEDGMILRRGRRAPLNALPVVIGGGQRRVTSLGATSWPLAAGVAARLVAGDGLAGAVAAPRAASTGRSGSVVEAEAGLDPSELMALARAGHEIRPTDRLGAAGGLTRAENGRIEAHPDPRWRAVTDGF